MLLVSTDPASNLDEVLGTDVGRTPTPVAGRPGLDAVDIDPEAAAAAYRERIVGPYRGALPAAAVASIEEQLSGACTVEIAAFDEFARLLGAPEATAGYDHVIFDTAPTGHTLRLLRLPGAWSEFIATNTTGTSCLGPLAGLESQRALYEATFAALTDPQRTTLVLVSRPESSALAGGRAQPRRARRPGRRKPAPGSQRRLSRQRRRRHARGSARGPSAHGPGGHPRRAGGTRSARRSRCSPFAPLGADALARVFDDHAPAPDTAVALAPPPPAGTQRLQALVDELAAPGRGLIMTMGKGGVGKTTIAAAIAVELARRGHPVHLTTTDPAAHVAQTVGGELERLHVSRIDPGAETRAYTEDVLADAGRELDANARALLEEDLRSPCTEEIAVFRAFARTVSRCPATASSCSTPPPPATRCCCSTPPRPTTAKSRARSDIPPEIAELLPRLRDPDFTRVLLVTVPEATPVHEAAQLAEDLQRAQIAPYAWVINQSLSQARPRDPVLAQRALAELPFITEVLHRGPDAVIVGWQPEPPVGASQLTALLAAA